MTEQKVLRIRGLSGYLGIGRSLIYQKLNPLSPRYDETFPRPIKLGARVSGWLKHEVDEWLESRARSRET